MQTGLSRFGIGKLGPITDLCPRLFPPSPPLCLATQWQRESLAGLVKRFDSATAADLQKKQQQQQQEREEQQQQKQQQQQQRELQRAHVKLVVTLALGEGD